MIQSYIFCKQGTIFSFRTEKSLLGSLTIQMHQAKTVIFLTQIGTSSSVFIFHNYK